MNGDELLQHLHQEVRLHAWMYLNGASQMWFRAVETQRDRIFNPDTASNEVQREVVFFAVALNNLLRTVELAAKLYPGVGIEETLGEFEKTTPNVREMRNVLHYLEHFVLGLGRPQEREQKSGSYRHHEWPIFYEGDGETLRFHVGSKGELDINAATQAAERLAGQVFEILNKVGMKK